MTESTVESTQPSPQPKRRRSLLRRIGRALLIVFLLVAIFHRPLFHTVARLALIKVAARQNLTLEVHFSGTIFTNLTVEGVRARPTGTAPSPVEKIDIERVHLEYSLPMLVKKGVGEFLRSYEVKNADLVFIAKESSTPNEKKQKRTLAEDLNNLLAQPAAYADRVRIDHFSIAIHAANSDTEVRGIDLLLAPDRIGFLRIEKLAAPGIPTWQNLTAETSYANRNFYIRGLALAPELVIDELNFDASQRAQHKGSTTLKAHVFGGTLELSLSGSQLDKKGENLEKSYDTTLHLDAENVSIAQAAAYFKKQAPPVERLAKLALVFTGEPEKPRTWRGNLAARVESITAGEMKLDAFETGATFADGIAKLTPSSIALGQNAVRFDASATLTESVNDLARSGVEGSLQIEAPDVAAFTAKMPDPIRGIVRGGGKFAMQEQKASVEIALEASEVVNKQIGLKSAKLKLSATKPLAPQTPWPLENLDSNIVAELTGMRVGTFAIDSAAVDATTRGALVTLRRLDVARGENAVNAKGTYQIPRDPKKAAASPINAEFSLKVPKLEEFGIVVKEKTLAGHLDGEGVVKFADEMLGGSIRLEGGDFQLGDFKAGPLVAKVTIAKNEATIDEFALHLSGTDQIALAGKSSVRPPFLYEGGAIVSVKDLAAYQPLLDALGVKEKIKGDVQIDWNGKAELANNVPAQSGDLSIAVTGAAYGKLDLREFKLAGIYGPGFAQSTAFNLAIGPTGLTGSLEVREGKLRFRDIALTQGDLTVLTGYIFLPLDLSNPKALVPLDQRIAANINAKDLDLEKLLASFGQQAPATGVVTANLVTGGTLLAPTAHLKVAAQKLKAKATSQLDSADVDLTVHYSQKELTIDGAVRQPQIQPLTIKGRAPFDLDATIQKKQLDPALPVDLAVKLPPSSLGIVPKLAPAVRRIEGTAGIDVHVGGTVGKPEFSGAVAVNVQSARLTDEAVPAIGGLQANLSFAHDTLTFQKLHGEIGGGTFDLGGSTKFVKLTEPVFALQLKAKDVLVKRDDSVTVRIDSDVKLDGPFKAATVGGSIFVTNSRFFREIDILPIGLPGRPKPKPREAPSNKTVSFDKPPLRDWKFDVAIKTRPDDPFRIRGNLANGGASLDLKLAGTGLQPYLAGSIAVENFVASLPFSKLNVTRGFIYFKQDAPFQPSLDLQAESSLRDYRVSAYIYGSASDPQVSLTSEPPLSQADIVSLLATGTTTSELTGNSDVLAGRAAVLVFQQLYRKIFKKREPSEERSLFDRINLDVGSVDNRTGRQEVSARFELGEQLYLIGELDVTGNFTGRLKYLLRYR